MAFRDADGKITIDENVAEKDIKQLRLSIEHMETAIRELQEIVVQADEFSGNTGTQIKTAGIGLINEIKKSIQESELSIEQIKMTVNKYQRIDAEVKNIINNGTN